MWCVHVYMYVHIAFSLYIIKKKLQIFEQVGKILEMNKMYAFKPEIYDKCK